MDSQKIKSHSSLRNAVIASLCCHGFVFAALNLYKVAFKKEAPVEVEYISLSPKVSNSIQFAKATADRKIIKSKRSIKVKKNQGLSRPKQQPQETSVVASKAVNVGRSDIESDLKGRAPKTPKEKYLAELRALVATQQSYPRVSRKFREQGTVKLLLTLEKNGSLKKIEIINKAPFERLNQAAMTAVTKAAPFASFPDSVTFTTWKVALPVNFKFSRN